MSKEIIKMVDGKEEIFILFELNEIIIEKNTNKIWKVKRHIVDHGIYVVCLHDPKIEHLIKSNERATTLDTYLKYFNR